MSQLRDPGLNERRCIVRHELGFYRGLVVAGVYTFPFKVVAQLDGSNEALLNYAIGPLRSCIQQHPILSTVIIGADSERPSFHKAARLEVAKHVQIWSAQEIKEISSAAVTSGKNGETAVIEHALERILNTEFDDVRNVPSWKVSFVPLPKQSDDLSGKLPSRARHLVAYAYSHSHGDGPSGMAFHRTFSNALSSVDPEAITTIKRNDTLWASDTYHQPLPLSLDNLTPLPISWSFLLITLASEFLPRALSTLPFWPSTAPQTPWTGSPIFYEKSTFRTAIQTISLSYETLNFLLDKCRSHGIKLTGLLDSFIAHSLTSNIDRSTRHHDSVVSSIAIDLRKATDASPDEMGVMASVLTQTHASPAQGHLERAKTTTEKLAKLSSTTLDQPVGLLRYVSSLKSWHTKKLGKRRDVSYEVSNIMVFEPGCNSGVASAEERGEGVEGGGVRIKEMFFLQPANVTGPALNFNVVSLKEGDLNLVISWQVGALGLDSAGGGGTEQEQEQEQAAVEETEREAVGRVCRAFQENVQRFSDEE